MRFYIPPNLQRDFTDSLNQLGTDAIINFDPLNNVKVRLDKVNYRTKDGKVTAQEVAFAESSSGLRLGDYLQYKDKTFIINQLKRDEFPDCLEFNTETCNTKLTVTRYEDMVQNEDGNILVEAGDHDIVEDLYCSTLFNSFKFGSTSGNVGIVPSDQLLVTCQFNDITKLIKIGDKFLWFDESYHIVSLDRAQVDISALYGILVFYGEKVVI